MKGTVPPREAGAETCWSCKGHGCQECAGTGRVVITLALSQVLAAAGHMLLDRTDLELAQLRREKEQLERWKKNAREVVTKFLHEMDRTGIDFTSIPVGGEETDGVDELTLIELRDLVRRP